MTWSASGDELNQDIFDALAEFFGQVLRCGDELAAEFGVPTFCVKAIHRLDASVTLKELGRRMHCDPSFVTAIADTLEERGLAKREPNPDDRRIKNLVLTPEGLELKARLEAALLKQMPWARALDAPERQALLSMLRRMNRVLAGTATSWAGEVSDTPITASWPQAGPGSTAGLRSEAAPATKLTENPA